MDRGKRVEKMCGLCVYGEREHRGVGIGFGHVKQV